MGMGEEIIKREGLEGMIEEIGFAVVSKLGFSPHIKVARESENMYVCRIQVSEDQNFLIGKMGTNLAAIQHLVRILIRRKTDEKVNIIVDVNDYFAGKKEALEKEAEMACQSVRETHEAVTLRPMQAYERKVIHSYLAENDAVITESIGSGDGRKLTIRPKEA